MNWRSFVCIVAIISPTWLCAQEANGIVYGDLFLNANVNFQNEQASFRLNRLHVGYKRQLSDVWYFNGMIESAREAYDPTGGYSGITNLFEFCIGYNSEKWTGKFGLIGTALNQQQEKLWKHRYVDKVFADKFGLAPTNDFGVMAQYKAHEKFAIDLTITNGEGHKNYQSDSTFRYAVGLSFYPTSAWVARLYADWVVSSSGRRSNYIAILGYANTSFSAGMEWNQQATSGDLFRYGYSIYASYDISSQFQLFARTDRLLSNTLPNTDQAWNIAQNGQLYIGGVEYKLLPNLSMAIDSRTWFSDLDRRSNQYLFFEVMATF